jgi:hypothetical protein
MPEYCASLSILPASHSAWLASSASRSRGARVVPAPLTALTRPPRAHANTNTHLHALQSHECKLRSKVVSTKIVNILAPDSVNSISSIPYAASNTRAGGASGLAAPENVNPIDRASMSCVRVENVLKAPSQTIGLEQQTLEIKGGAELASALKLNKALEQEARQKERIATATAAKLEELARALFQKEADRSQLEQDNRRLQLAAQQAAVDLARAHDQVAALHTQARLQVNASLNGSGATRVEMSGVLSDANDLLQSLQEAKSSTASGPFGRSHVTERSASDRPSLIGGHRSLSTGLESALSGASREESVMSTDGGFVELASIRRERAKALIQILANVPERENTLARSRSGSQSDLVSESRCCVCAVLYICVLSIFIIHCFPICVDVRWHVLRFYIAIHNTRTCLQTPGMSQTRMHHF